MDKPSDAYHIVSILDKLIVVQLSQKLLLTEKKTSEPKQEIIEIKFEKAQKDERNINCSVHQKISMKKINVLLRVKHNIIVKPRSSGKNKSRTFLCYDTDGTENDASNNSSMKREHV
jgi:hypothetical protein